MGTLWDDNAWQYEEWKARERVRLADKSKRRLAQGPSESNREFLSNAALNPRYTPKDCDSSTDQLVLKALERKAQQVHDLLEGYDPATVEAILSRALGRPVR